MNEVFLYIYSISDKITKNNRRQKKPIESSTVLVLPHLFVRLAEILALTIFQDPAVSATLRRCTGDKSNFSYNIK